METGQNKNEKIFKLLEEETVFFKTIKDLVPLFFYLGIANFILNSILKENIRKN